MVALLMRLCGCSMCGKVAVNIASSVQRTACICHAIL